MDFLQGFEREEACDDPRDPDSDDDGLFDGDEVNTHGTDPISADTDGLLTVKLLVAHLPPPLPTHDNTILIAASATRSMRSTANPA